MKYEGTKKPKVMYAACHMENNNKEPQTNKQYPWSIFFFVLETMEKNIGHWLIITHGVTFRAQSQRTSIYKRLFTGTGKREENTIG